MKRLVAIVGPTAIGKSSLALSLAQAFNGEVIGADSRQVYRHMDIGTAKPTQQERSLVPHHLIDIISPDEDFSLAQYQQLARQTIENIQQHNRLPLLVGGSGQYVWAVLEGWQVPRVAPDLELRRSLEEKEASLGEILDMAVQIAEGLNAAHAKDVVHRDIKPANIMLTSSGTVKIMDFGLAKLKGATKLTKTGTTMGTLPYMSPEQAGGRDVDGRSDIFSLGAMLYEMITGRLPFQGDNEAAIIRAIISDEPEPLARYKSGISDGLQRIISKTLAKDRAERYQHADEMLADQKNPAG